MFREGDILGYHECVVVEVTVTLVISHMVEVGIIKCLMCVRVY